MAVEFIGGGNDDGCVFGQTASDKTAFHNATPSIQQTAAVAVGTASATTGSYGFATSTQADAIVTGLNVVMTILDTKGLSA